MLGQHHYSWIKIAWPLPIAPSSQSWWAEDYSCQVCQKSVWACLWFGEIGLLLPFLVHAMHFPLSFFLWSLVLRPSDRIAAFSSLFLSRSWCFVVMDTTPLLSEDVDVLSPGEEEKESEPGDLKSLVHFHGRVREWWEGNEANSNTVVFDDLSSLI